MKKLHRKTNDRTIEKTRRKVLVLGKAVTRINLHPVTLVPPFALKCGI